MEGATAPTTVNKDVSNMVTFMSWNSTGFNTVKSEWINNILNEKNVTFCSIQEHFKTAQNSDKFFKNYFSDFSSYVIPAFRAVNQDNGRPKGGLAQMLGKCLKIKTDRVKTDNRDDD